MKLKAFIICIIFIVTLTVNAQDRNIEDPFSISLGINAIDSSGKQNPFNFLSNTDELAFSTPFELGANYDISNAIDVYTKLSLNKFDDINVDGSVLENDISFFAIDLGVDYYFYTTSYNQDFYAIGGLGYVSLEDTYFTGNIGVGTKYWFNDAVGVYLNVMGKFALENKAINSNFFQYSIGLTYKFYRR